MLTHALILSIFRNIISHTHRITSRRSQNDFFSRHPPPGSMLVLQSRGQPTNFDRNWALTNIEWGEGGCVNNFVRDCSWCAVQFVQNLRQPLYPTGRTASSHCFLGVLMTENLLSDGSVCSFYESLCSMVAGLRPLNGGTTNAHHPAYSTLEFRTGIDLKGLGPPELSRINLWKSLCTSSALLLVRGSASLYREATSTTTNAYL